MCCFDRHSCLQIKMCLSLVSVRLSCFCLHLTNRHILESGNSCASQNNINIIWAFNSRVLLLLLLGSFCCFFFLSCFCLHHFRWSKRFSHWASPICICASLHALLKGKPKPSPFFLRAVSDLLWYRDLEPGGWWWRHRVPGAVYREWSCRSWCFQSTLV